MPADLPFGISPSEVTELPGGHCSRVFALGDRVLKIPFRGEEQTTGLTAALALQRAGDLRHENILWDALAQEWRPIDPNGGFGEPEVDAVAWLRSPFVQFGTVAEILRLTEGRFVRMEAELGWSRERGVDLAVAGLDELLDEVEEGHP